MIKIAAETDQNDCVWFKFEKEVDLKTQGEYGGIRLVFRSGIGEPLTDIRRAQLLHFDLGIGDPVTPGPIQHQSDELLGNNRISWQVYPIETMIAEKIHALVERGSENSRSKDVFDLSQFLLRANSKILRDALAACFQYRETNLPKNLALHLKSIDLTLLEKGWASAVSGIKNAPKCRQAFDEIIAQLEKMEF